ncbi:MAG: TerB family tellurite resistance protein [Alphaproteobacteria bacterium]|nr:TerB family tellurite resistance protein [Alphaproteobacteria bacterium]
MNIWGKLIGGLTGFLSGGPVGAAIGAVLGHVADQKGAGALGMGSPLPGGMTPIDMAAYLGQRETVFAIGVVVLSAKLAKSDGPVKRVEIDAFKQLFRVPPEGLRDVAALYDQARADARGFEPYAAKLGEVFADNKGMLEDVLAALFFIAKADGPVTVGELAMLREVYRAFALSPAAWDRAVRGQPGFGQSAAARPLPDEPDPYETLGIARSASDEEVRLAWRQLMRENHPDALAARGVPEEFVKSATDKVARINAAWDRVKRERGLG